MNILTNAGEDLLGRAIAGETVTFTRFKAGNGNAPSDPEEMTDLVNPILTFSIDDIDKSVEGKISITGSFNSSDASAEFRVREVGLFAKGEENEEVLVFYINHGDDAGTVDPASVSENVAYTKTVVIEIERAGNITAIVINPSEYATKAQLDEHSGDTSNPHSVTAEQVGLGNVPNVATNDQTPSYSEASEISELESGEPLSIAFGKIKKAIKSLISHLSNTSNPHGVTLAQVGGAAASHTHSTANIISGTLPIARGGTGINNESELLATYHVPVFGVFKGDGTREREINLGFKPSAVFITDHHGMLNDGTYGHPTGGFVVRGYINISQGDAYSEDFINIINGTRWSTISGSYDALRISNSGFKVVYNASSNILLNDEHRYYYYVAWR